MSSHIPTPSNRPRRIDLHCHSRASSKPAEAMLGAIRCPECYSDPLEVYNQARARGMDFVTVTDHDTLNGVTELAAGRDDVLIGEELTCWFPEDHCKLHLLVYGITPEDHDRLQKLSRSVYDVATYIEKNRIAHSVAHPLYRQNEKLERWHLERLLLLFKGFECLNGAHSPLHREAFEPVLSRLTRQEIQRLAERHGLLPKWPEPWFKARTAGSDDHGLLNIGRTYTEFPTECRTVEDILNCLREGACQPAGEAGSSPKLAHTFYSVAVRYFTRHLMGPNKKPNMSTSVMQMIAGDRPVPTKRQLAGMALKHRVKTLCNDVACFGKRIARRPVAAIAQPNAQDAVPAATPLLPKLFMTALKDRLPDHPQLCNAMERGLPPLGEHVEMFRLASQINRDVSRGVADAINAALDNASFVGLFDGISAGLAQQFVLIPYYFSVFHQNKERHLLRQITGRNEPKDPETLRIGLFTDTLDDTNGVARFIRDMAVRADRRGLLFTLHTCSNKTKYDVPGRKNFEPLISRPMPYYPELSFNIPPILEILEWADRQQFDVVHVSTPGPMGLCGWLVSKMLRVPLVGTYHTDFPAYIEQYTQDHRLTTAATGYMSWLYGQMSAVLSRSKAYRFKLHDLHVPDERLVTLPAAVDIEKFNPSGRQDNIWKKLGVKQPRRLLYVGRVSTEKNLPMLVEAFKWLCTRRQDTALVIAGDGPYLEQMRQELRGQPAYFLGYQNDAQLVPLYCGADMLVFPSRTDTLGQVVMEAIACGLPAIVSNEGGPKEIVDDGLTGVVLPAHDARRWADAIEEILNDDTRRSWMSRAASQRSHRFSLDSTFDVFWQTHGIAVNARREEEHFPIEAVRPGV